MADSKRDAASPASPKGEEPRPRTTPAAAREIPDSRAIQAKCPCIRDALVRIHEIPDKLFIGAASVIINTHRGGEQVAELLEKRPDMKSFLHRYEEARSSGMVSKCSDFRHKLGGEEFCGKCEEWNFCRTPLQLGLPHAQTPLRKQLILRGDEHIMLCALEDGLKKAVEDGQQVYQYAGQIAQIKHLKGVPQTEVVSPTALKTLLQERYRMVYEDDEGSEKPLPGVQISLTKQLLERRRWSIPALRGIVKCPVFAENGSLSTTEGYNPITEVFLHLGGCGVPTIPVNPTDDVVANAKRFIFEEFLVDFKFKDAASLAHVVGLGVLPFIRPLIDGPIPLHLVSAHAPGCGKTWLVDLLAIIATGEKATCITESDRDWAWQKRITSTLRDQPTTVVIDNFKKKLDSGSLASVLTHTMWTDKLDRVSRNITVPNNAIWCATANHPKLSPELSRRTVLIRFDPNLENPSLRTNFRHANIIPWTKDNRSQLMQAFLILISNWFAKGRPVSNAVMGSYEAYTQIVGGILEVNGISGFLQNQQELLRTVDAAEVEIEAFVQSWAGAFGAERVSIAQLVGHAESHKLMASVLSGTTTASKKYALGQKLRKINNNVVGGYVIHYRENKSNKTYSYNLTPVSVESDSIESNPADEPVSPAPAR
ncbi:MAG: hypothetical protein HQM09_21495 [Candidatus Riflebacteria bacterium]|nr:hypothetical protein [Candidatus Riflebacteria bacterium]